MQEFREEAVCSNAIARVLRFFSFLVVPPGTRGDSDLSIANFQKVFVVDTRNRTPASLRTYTRILHVSIIIEDQKLAKVSHL